MPFGLFAAWQQPGYCVPDLSELKAIASHALVPGPWTLETCHELALALAPPSQLASINPHESADQHLAGAGLVLFDGFLSNRPELKALLDHGSQRSESDADWVAAVFRKMGANSLSRLKGNFAVCVVCPRQRRILAVRDRLGGRTLYRSRIAGRLAVASRSAMIAALPGFDCQEDSGFVARRLALRFPPEMGHTAFSSIEELAPGSQWHWEDGAGRLIRSPLEPAGDNELSDPAEAVEAFADTFCAAVDSTLGRSGHVAVMLSGGMDSGPAAVVASEKLTARNDRLLPVSWVVPGLPRADESRWISELCDFMGCSPTTIPVGTENVLAELGGGAANPDLPGLNPYRQLVNACYQSAADAGCRIVLNGNAGDELYPPPGLLLPDLWRRGEYQAWLRMIMCRLLRTRFIAAHRDPFLRGAARHWRQRWLRPTRPKAPPAWLTPWAMEQLRVPEAWPPEVDTFPLPDYARQVLGASMAFGRAHEMAWCERFGIERRDPFQNEELVRLVLDLPVSFSYREGMDKWIMRQAMKGRMPDSLRLKQRTGLLHSLFHAGWNAHRQKLHRLLFEEQRDWQRYVRPEPVHKALQTPVGSDRRPDRRIMMVTVQCVGHALWRQYLDG